ncbi:uncharacterized protein F4807DRAFT_457228 [Annulohypoxylon truncatum]|uniref:uncharacterized protein n=1 Tax=Annulohypoxylon truncatum TaxID=327061 RepID=UPI00200765A1|nr:uncharacterized protein F4807DRAFT_457228 [Annulohypoxylon truncatum]KAI1213143.1 hypothetical protein F4807DRAFT_457228 [Annulohypoxylon truncatum]
MAPLSTLPVELIREIGNNLDSPRELLKFSSTCKYVHSAIGVTELAVQDVKRLAAIWKLNTCAYNGKSSSRCIRSPVDTHQPLLLEAIDTGKHIDYIRQCMKIYQQNFPDFLRGKWYGALGNIIGILPRFPEPIYLAAKLGRLDVVQALLEFGIKARYPMKFENDEYMAACQAGHDDIACFFVSNGLPLIPEEDLICAVQNGCFQTVSSLLLHPWYNGDKGEDFKLITLFKALGSVLPNKDIIFPLLDAIHILSDAEKISNIRESLMEVLIDPYVGAGRDYQHAYNTLSPGRVIQSLKVLEKLTPSLSIEVGDIVREAAKFDTFLPVIQLVLSGDQWKIGQSEDERSKVVEDAMSVAICFHSSDIIQCLVSRGCRFSTVHLYQAIQAGELKLIEDIINSGVSVNSSFDFEHEALELNIMNIIPHPRYRIRPQHRYPHLLIGNEIHKTPLELALHMIPKDSDFLVLSKLLFLGADHTNLPEDEKNWLFRRRYLFDLIHDRYFDERRLEEKPADPDGALNELNRQSHKTLDHNV